MGRGLRCRVSTELQRRCGFNLHWTQFYDDYFLVAGERESQHVDLIQTSFFTLLGWETASEKDFGFGFVTRALGVQIDLSDCRIGLVKICNTMSRRQELEQLIDEILSSPSVSGSVLTSLRGGDFSSATIRYLAGWHP